MSNFCEQCPLRYEATGEIEGIASTPAGAGYEVRALLGHGAVTSAYTGKMGLLIDEK